MISFAQERSALAPDPFACLSKSVPLQLAPIVGGGMQSQKQCFVVLVLFLLTVTAIGTQITRYRIVQTALFLLPVEC